MKRTLNPAALEKFLSNAAASTGIVGHVDAIDDPLVVGDLTLASSAAPTLLVAVGGAR
jgi:hypothetical protein